MTLIQINHLSKLFTHDKTPFYALKDINLSIKRGEILGLVGASGSGKTTLGKIVLNLMQPTEGTISTHFRSSSNRKNMQMVFQDPHGSLNPRMTVYELIAEPIIIHRLTPHISDRVFDLLKMVDLDPAFHTRTPAALSGGQKQRVAIARALAQEPRFIVFDEAVSALDVSLQAQVINLLKKVHREFNLTYLFISHDLSVVKYLSDRVAVLYDGRLVELASTETIFESPLHPYTKKMLAALSTAPFDKETNPLLPISGERKTHFGCDFCEYCPLVEPICRKQKPCLEEKRRNHLIACHQNEHFISNSS